MDEIERLREGCARFVEQAIGVALDGTPDTLPILDHYLVTARDGDALEPAVIDLLAASAGAYFGSVVVACVPGARWHVAAEPLEHRVELDHVFLAIRPVALARALLVAPDADAPPDIAVRPIDREVVAQSLDHLGPVDADDYRTLSLRFEVLEQCIDAVSAAAQARGEAPRRWAPEDYAVALDE